MNYKDKRWKFKREQILKRDKYLCRECRKYGKNIDADTVHHINPAETFTQYIFKEWNLISLCRTCHGKMHIRNTHELTVLGKSWQSKINIGNNTQVFL